MAFNLATQLKTYRLSQIEYEKIKSLLGREPQGVEWALFSALWSEHCSYKSSKVHLKNLFRDSQRVLQSFGENAGVVDLGRGEKVAFKMESHNHPSFIEPYQGAATGVGGILRDIFTMGARPIALADYLCFGEMDAPRMNALVDGVVSGIGGYGNCVGVPTITGQTEFHSTYNQNILVNAMAVGYFGKDDPIVLSKAQSPGARVIYAGAKTGRDGVHGASMASESFSGGSAADGGVAASKRPTVQIGDPFFEKLLIEACLDVMKQNLVVAIQDMGAAGLTSSSFEMASKGAVGLDLDLSHVPLRDSTMQPEEILLSESQERMLLIVEPKNVAAVQEVFRRWGLDASDIGEVTNRKTVRLLWKGEVLTELDPDLLVENAPEYKREFQPWTTRLGVKHNTLSKAPAMNGGIGDGLRRILNSTRGGSRAWIYRQYDQRVGAKTARDATQSFGVIRLPESGRALGVIVGCRPHIMRLDAEQGGRDAVLKPALELACKGFEPLAVTDCLNFGNPEKIHVMSEFVAALSGLNESCQALVTPIISGNVSFYNETEGRNITATPAIGMIGLRESVETIPLDTWSYPGDSILLLRLPLLETTGLVAELDGAEPTGSGAIDVSVVARFVTGLQSLAHRPEVTASRVVGKFGRLYSLARMTIESGVGARVRLPEHLLNFNEALYEVIVVVKSAANGAIVEEMKKMMAPLGGEVLDIGVTGGDNLRLNTDIEISVDELKREYHEIMA